MKNAKLSKFMLKITTFLTVFVLFFSFLLSPLPSIFASASISANESEIDRPESLSAGLSRKTLSEIQGKRVTIRQPKMEILATGLSRHEPEVYDNEFTLPDFETGELSKAKITFSHYPIFSNDEKNTSFTNFEKYMLLRQVFWLNQNAMDYAEHGTLKKHPAADLQYDEAIPMADNAVSKRITTDPDYRSPMTTGLYLAPGEVVTVVVKGLKEGESLTLYTHHQQTEAYINNDVPDYFKTTDSMIIAEAQKDSPNYDSLDIKLNSQYARQMREIPAMGATFKLTENEHTYKIGCAFGGPLYINPTSSSVEVTITGAVETPHFILGVTTKQEFEDRLRDAPGIIATLDCENGQLIGPAKYMRQCDDIEKLAYFWHSAFAVNASFNGRPYNYNVTLSFDTHVPAGAAVALSSDRAAHPSDWFESCMQYSKITTSGNWGVFHELGHIHANAYGVVWGMKEGKEGEVRNNALIILIYTLLCNMDSRIVGVEHGEFTHPYTTLNYYKNMAKYSDYSELDYFDMLSMYSSLIHYFSPEVFVDFLYTYSMENSYCNNSRADFVYRIALTTHMDIRRWLNVCYFANITDNMFSDEQRQFLNDLKEFYPIAYRYANGINDLETARRAEIDCTRPTTFDFSGDNIICPEDFLIVSYRQPKYGKIQISKSMDKVTYYPPTDANYEGDEFAVRVRIRRTGVDVYLPVRFNFAYKNSYSEVWDDIPTRDIDEAILFTKHLEPTYTETSAVPGKNTWTAPTKADGSALQSFISTKFKFVATESGEHKFFTRSDDSSRVVFTKGGQNEQSLTIKGDRSKYDLTQYVTYNLNVGDIVEVETFHVNFGGKGYLFVGVQMPSMDSVADIPNKNMLNASLSKKDMQEIEKFTYWTPKFFVSIKNAEKKNEASKDGWQVLEAPKAESESQEKELLVDGDASTVYHSRWHAGYDNLPHIFTIDTCKVQPFNYFEITTRTNSYGNSQIYSLELYGSTTNDEGSYSLLYSSDKITYANYRALLKFDETQLRFFKLKVNSTSGGYFTVIAELSAGISARMEQTLKPSTLESSNTGFEEDSLGTLTSTQTGNEFSFEFEGTGFQIFANTGDGYGSASVTIDNRYYATIDLNDDLAINKLVLSVNNLKSKSHKVKIRTLSEAQFNISFLNLSYGSPTNEGPEPEKPVFDPKFEEYVFGHSYNEPVVPEVEEQSREGMLNIDKPTLTIIIIVTFSVTAIIILILVVCKYSLKKRDN